MIKPPYLEDHKWPTSREPGERIVNPSDDHILQNYLLDEFLKAMEQKSPGLIRETLVELIYSLINENMESEL